ncbi:hypothetical protein ACFGXV_00775 [Pasteurella multocida]|uniref:hypothetical protein n=1 Tax=Pasteurella multocida TaxID=747 RepID=UPI00292F709A|nr:hypothetical protein [Pasteurella multocida]WNY73926.1 hypothetical protein H2512_10965 [Pasteurella multocida]HDR1911980.1 hypothetical protein [Pasteurella multocida]HDR1913218.1 hypothetical protein [Pasteurella multocida]
MTIFYKDGFYIEEQEIPSGAVEINEERYIELLNGQSAGKLIVSDKSGNPILIDSAPSEFHELVDGVWTISVEKQTQLKHDLIQKLTNNIDNTAAYILSKWTRFTEEYKLREAAAIAFKETGFTGDVSIYISSFATVAGLDNQSATLLILQQAQSLRTLQEQLAVQRMRKYELKHEELSDEDLRRIHDDIISKMQALAEVQQ